jgi:transcriptional regulator with GAF, ATPase, and Fis domain
MKNAATTNYSRVPITSVWDHATRYKLLLDINNAIVNQTTRESLFRALAQEIRRIVAYDRFSISIYDPQTKSLEWFAHAEGLRIKSMDGNSRPCAKGPVANSVITSQVPLIIPDMATYSHWPTIRQMMEAGLKATMAFPLLVRNNVVGSLNFSFCATPSDMNELAEFLNELSGQVALSVDNMLAHSRLVNQKTNLEQQRDFLLSDRDNQYNPGDFYYSSPAMREIMRQVELIAKSDASILITGETGTGKGYLARYIHHLSQCSKAMFVKVNCPALAPSLFESELFGHAKGAFTGANTKRLGRFEMANGGTLFLDEIGELPIQLQAKLLNVLQDKTFERVGESRPITVDFRIIAATNSDMEQAIQEKSFRSDLFYRLNTVSIHIPPLRERNDEVVPLLLRLTRAQAKVLHRPPPSFSDEVLEVMQNYNWPGNVRELSNIVNRLIIINSGQHITRRHLSPLLSAHQTEAPSRTLMSLAESERAHLIRVLTATKGVVGGKYGATAILKVPKSTLQYRLRKHGVNPNDFAKFSPKRPAGPLDGPEDAPRSMDVGPR